jgi:hypothetical protein
MRSKSKEEESNWEWGTGKGAKLVYPAADYGRRPKNTGLRACRNLVAECTPLIELHKVTVGL